MTRRPDWDERCIDILRSHASSANNVRIAELIERATGRRFTSDYVSERRRALGRPTRNDWTSPLRPPVVEPPPHGNIEADWRAVGGYMKDALRKEKAREAP